MYRYLLIMFFLSCTAGSLSADGIDSVESESALRRLLYQIYSGNNAVLNRPTVEIAYGASSLTLPVEGFKGTIAPTYSTELRYGFTRLNEYMPASGVFHYAGEYVSMMNQSSNMSLLSKPPSDETISDYWRFALSSVNGYGYNDGVLKGLTFIHAGRITWAELDIMLPTPFPEDDKYFDKIDEKTKFGIAFESSIKYRLSDVIFVNLSYEHNLIYPNFSFGQWILGSGTELMLQRGVDFVGFSYMYDNPKLYPVANFAVKTLISFVLYELRRENQFIPFYSDTPYSYDGFKLGMTFAFRDE
jgi:hypothetical protein